MTDTAKSIQLPSYLQPGFRVAQLFVNQSVYFYGHLKQNLPSNCSPCVESIEQKVICLSQTIQSNLAQKLEQNAETIRTGSIWVKKRAEIAHSFFFKPALLCLALLDTLFILIKGSPEPESETENPQDFDQIYSLAQRKLISLGSELKKVSNSTIQTWGNLAVLKLRSHPFSAPFDPILTLVLSFLTLQKSKEAEEKNNHLPDQGSSAQESLIHEPDQMEQLQSESASNSIQIDEVKIKIQSIPRQSSEVESQQLAEVETQAPEAETQLPEFETQENESDIQDSDQEREKATDPTEDDGGSIEEESD